MKPTLWLVWATISLLNGACTSIEPDYPLAVVEYDEGLVGTWVGRSRGPAKEGAPADERDVRLIVSPRVVRARAGRLNPAEPMVVRRGEAVEEVTQYSLVFEGLIEDDLRAPLRFNAYLLRCGERRLIGAQVPEEALTDVKLVRGLVLPVHWFFDLRRDGDALTLSLPERPVLWLPWVVWAHSPGEFPPIHPEQLEGGAFAVTTSIDAVIEYYGRAPPQNPERGEQWRFERQRE